jgi:hypothetical protein
MSDLVEGDEVRDLAADLGDSDPRRPPARRLAAVGACTPHRSDLDRDAVLVGKQGNVLAELREERAGGRGGARHRPGR